MISECAKKSGECAKKSANSFTHIFLEITKKNERFTVFVLPLEQNKTLVEPLLFLDLLKRLNFKSPIFDLYINLCSYFRFL